MHCLSAAPKADAGVSHELTDEGRGVCGKEMVVSEGADSEKGMPRRSLGP